MKIMVIGAGAREHALAWKILQSPHLSQLFINSTNASIQLLQEKYGAEKISSIHIADDDIAALTQCAVQKKIDAVIIGPEIPLALGLSDALQAENIRVFGPSQAAAQIETDKAFAKDFFTRHHIPTARYAVCHTLSDALHYLRQVDYAVVIKASGLASGKGVFLPATIKEAEMLIHQLMAERILGAAGETLVIEERLQGKEVSLLAFSDGKTLKLMPPACDYKRLKENNIGPNTGGMGAFAPATEVCSPALQDIILRHILQPTVDGLRAEGRPFIGVLYAGIMLTADGPRVLEFNCRFGDPETQVLLPLLSTDLLEIINACIDEQLEYCDIHWKNAQAVCVVLAGKNYPAQSDHGEKISGLPTDDEGLAIFHAGTRWHDQHIETNGGRILSVAAWDAARDAARARAYQTVQHIHFNGMQYRKDIG